MEINKIKKKGEIKMPNTKDTLTIFKNIFAPKGQFHQEVKKALSEGWHLYKMGKRKDNMICMVVYKKIPVPAVA